MNQISDVVLLSLNENDSGFRSPVESLEMLGLCNKQDWQSPITGLTSFQPTLGF